MFVRTDGGNFCLFFAGIIDRRGGDDGDNGDADEDEGEENKLNNDGEEER